MSAGLPVFCCDERRRTELRRPGATLNGIDFLEVVDRSAATPGERQRKLRVSFVRPPGPLTHPATGIRRENVHIEGGERIRDVRVDHAEFDGDVLVVTVSVPGDYSTYRLRIGLADGSPLPGMDAVLSAVDFSFKVECASDFDCLPDCRCAVADRPEPALDYLAKDYESFRQLLLDRISLLVPGWSDRNAADVGIALVELFSYVGDYLSYQQDAVATEAYLGTARRRVSVRRHAKLVDYAMHDGCNARTFVHFEVRAQTVVEAALGIPLPAGTKLLTRLEGRSALIRPDSADYAGALAGGAEIFETMHDAVLAPELNELRLYAWGERECCLPAGATRATLGGDFRRLRPGDLLLLEEVVGPNTGERADADPTKRHVVRLTEVLTGGVDPLYATTAHPSGRPLTEVAWAVDDALPFALCVSAVADPLHGSRYVEPVSVARGNVVLADHGRTVAGEELGEPRRSSARLAADTTCDRCGGRTLVEPPSRFAPALAQAPVTHAARSTQASVAGRRGRVFFDARGSAASALSWEMAHVLPVARLEDAAGRVWLPQHDLLSSDAFAPEFVAETDDDGRTTLRFGDGEHGQRPAVGVPMTASYRVGNGIRGNVGADSLRHVATSDPQVIGRIVAVRNPLPGRGGAEPESSERVRQDAPAAFRTLDRAVTPADYAEVAQRHPEVQRAEATVRWTGSWRTIFVTIDRAGARPVDAAFEAAVRAHLERFRMAGHDVEIDGPRFVPLELELLARVQPQYFRGDVERALREALGPSRRPDGTRGTFHSDNFTFGQPVRLSVVYATAQAVPGVAYVEVLAFHRLGRPDRKPLEEGVLRVGRLEIARLDDDPSFPERGVLRLRMKGGR